MATGSGDRLLADLVDLGGAGAEVVELRLGSRHARPRPGVVRIGLHRQGPRPRAGLQAFDILLTADAEPPRPWVSAGASGVDQAAEALCDRVRRQPAAAAAMARVLRITPKLAFDDALVVESLAYSMLLGSGEFRAWRSAHPPSEAREDCRTRVALARGPEGGIQIRLDRPSRRNAFDAAMRDALVEALDFALADPDRGPVVLSAAGPSFSAGGDLNEFGLARDPGRAHLIRILRSPARLAHELGDRLTVRLHGACVGAGVEIPAAARRVVAEPDIICRLPEVSMGLVPGAGGCVTIPRRIGRHRAAYMALSGAAIEAETALAWGLADALETPA